MLRFRILQAVIGFDAPFLQVFDSPSSKWLRYQTLKDKTVIQKRHAGPG